MGRVLQKPIPHDSRIRLRLKQPGMEARVVINLPPIRHVGIEILVDRGLRRTADLIAQLLVLIVQPLQLGTHRMVRGALCNVDQLGPEIVQILLCQITRHFRSWTGASAPSLASTSGLPTSPAWMMGSQPASAANACGRSRPWVSEIAPMIRIMPDQPTRGAACAASPCWGSPWSARKREIPRSQQPKASADDRAAGGIVAKSRPVGPASGHCRPSALVGQNELIA